MLHKSLIGVMIPILAGIFLSACQTQPTRIVETKRREFSLVVSRASTPIEITEKTIILDVRSPFAFGLNHVENSHRFSTQDLMESMNSRLLGQPLKNAHLVGRRLSLAGLSPETPVVVVGDGINGHGEEGQLAWMLLYFGLTDVTVASVDVFRKNWTHGHSGPVANAPLWAPQPRDYLLSTESGVPSRSIALGNSLSWKEFYTQDGRPAASVRERLIQMGINLKDTIVVSGATQAERAATAYALLALGYPNVKLNFH